MQKQPKLRFQSNNLCEKSWQSYKIEDLIEYEQPTNYIVNSENYKTYGTPVLTANKSFIIGFTDENFGIYSKDEAIIFDDFTCDCKYVNFAFKIKSSAIKILTVKDRTTTSLRCFYEALRHKNFIPEGHNRHWISLIQEQDIQLPCFEEQQKIAEFFTALDEKIHSIENKLSLLDRTKKYFVNALLQKKLRFIKDNGSTYTDWVSCNVANIADVIGGGTPSTTDEAYWNGDINWFTPAEINSKYLIPSKRKISKLGLDNSSAKLLPKNSLLLTTRASLGLCSINSLDSFVCTNQGFQSLICKENAFHEFVYYMVTSDAFKKELKTKASGSTFLEVSSASLKSIKIEIPCYEEQIKIANFISQMDLKIELLVKQKKVFEKMKKAFMQRMFV